MTCGVRRDVARCYVSKNQSTHCAGRGISSQLSSTATDRGRGIYSDDTNVPDLATAGLTARELDLLALIAEGLTNEAIGERLFLSVKTVEGGVRSVFMKLGLLENTRDNRRVLATRIFLAAAETTGPTWPVWLSEFVGRQTELDELEKLAQAHRLVTVVGPGGIGKTRVVGEMGNRLGPDGASIHFIDLSSSGATSLLALILDSFDLVLTSELAGWRKLDRMFRVADRVIVFDNAEVRLDDVRDVVIRLAQNQRVYLVVTSRVPLKVAGERVYHVAPMKDEEATQLLRIRIADAGFDTTEIDDDAEQQLVSHLGGMPLAIELAAGQFPAFTADEITRHLAASLVADSDRPGRHASIAVALQSSYDGLSPDARRLFRRLSPFVGGCTLASLRYALGTELSETSLGQLIGSSLVSRVGDRYRMLDPVRFYAKALNDQADDRAQTYQRFISWCEQLARRAFAGYPARPSEWAQRLDPESGNIDEVIDTAIEARDFAVALRICGGLANYWSERHPGAGLLVVERVLAALDGTEDDLDRAWGQMCAGILRMAIWDLDRAEQLLTAAADIFERRCEHTAHMVARLRASRHDRSIEQMARVLELAVAHRSPHIEALAQAGMASSVMYRWPVDDLDHLDRFVIPAEAALRRAEEIYHQFESELLAITVRQIRAFIDLAVAHFTGQPVPFERLDRIAAEVETLAQSSGGDAQIADSMSDHNLLRLHASRFEELRSALPEQLERTSATDDRYLLIEGILLTAGWLVHDQQPTRARNLVASCAAAYLRYMDVAWLSYHLPVPELVAHAHEHLHDPVVTTKQLHGLLDECLAALTTPLPSDPTAAPAPY